MKRIKELQETIAKAQAELEALQCKSKRWRASEGDCYFTVDRFAKNGVSRLKEEGDKADKLAHLVGNYFRTEAEAQRALERMIATQQIKDRIAELNAQQGWVADWSDAKQDKHLPIFARNNNRMSLDCGYLHTWSPVEFYGSKEAIKTVIAEMPEQIKLWLGVEQ